MAVPDGLDTAEVARRRAAGQGNVVRQRSSRSVWSIVRANVLTRFNAIIGVLLVIVLVFGEPQDGLFGLVIVVNSAVGIIQEVRAKRTLDGLALLERAPVLLRRDGNPTEVPPEELVAGDLVLLTTGAKVPVDGQVSQATGLELDESLLTGEADPVPKGPGDQVLSGSFVVAGSGGFVATRVGADAYANRVAGDARRFDLAHSELLAGINRILRVLTWLIVPVGALLLVSQVRGDDTMAQAAVASVAGIVPMIPEGLVLLTSVAFAVGVVRLGRRRCLVQELPAIEVLARVDVLCLDKTGTLTAPELDLDRVHPVAPFTDGEVRTALAALARLDPAPNPTMRAIAAMTPAAPTDQQEVPDAGTGPAGWAAATVVPFSSARKYSAADFGDRGGSWVLGAPDVILAADDPQRGRGGGGRRGGAAGTGAGPARPSTADGRPARNGPTGRAGGAAPAVAAGSGRDAAVPERGGVTVKVFSGDNAASVGGVARALDLPGAGRSGRRPAVTPGRG